MYAGRFLLNENRLWPLKNEGLNPDHSFEFSLVSVLFIQASSQPDEAIQRLHADVAKVFSEEFTSIRLPQSGEKITPHLTIANKDLTKQKFKEAWEVFGKRKFEERFIVNSIFPLRHVEGIWKLEKEIRLGK